MKVLSEKQLSFAASRAAGMSLTESAEKAGYKGDRGTLGSTGSRLNRDPTIRAEIRRLQAMAAQEVGLTVLKVLRDLEDTRREASKEGNFSAAIRCSELQGNYLDMWRKNHRHTTLDQDGVETGLRVVCIPLVDLRDEPIERFELGDGDEDEDE